MGMSENEISERVSHSSSDEKEAGLTARCPMAAMCEKVVVGPRLKTGLFLAGGILAVLGLSIMVQPKVLIWLIALIFIAMGAAMVTGGYYLSRMK
jgi:hypothetical protein